MAKFHDMLGEIFSGDEGQQPDALAMQARLTAAYDEDFSVPAAKITDLTAKVTQYGQDEIQWKATNYDLLMKVPGANVEVQKPHEENELTIDSLFGKAE